MPKKRTNIEDDYVSTIMDRYGVRTKTEVVDLALRHLAGQPMTTAGGAGDARGVRHRRPAGRRLAPRTRVNRGAPRDPRPRDPNRDYWQELSGGFDTYSLDIFHVLLHVDSDVLAERVRADELEQKACRWRLDHRPVTDTCVRRAAPTDWEAVRHRADPASSGP